MDTKKKSQRVSSLAHHLPPETLVKFMPPGAPPDVVKALGMLYIRAVMLSDQYDICVLCLIETLDNVMAAAEEKGAIEHSNQPGITGYATVQ